MRLELKDIIKKFYGVTVLNQINIEFNPGEVHALVGENGAGKSTLIKIIGGIYSLDNGKIIINGKETKISSASDASKQKISIVFQEYNLVKGMTVIDNVMLGKEIIKNNGNIDYIAEKKFVSKIAGQNNINIDLDKYAEDLSSAEAKIVEILRACTNEMELLILDEPTAALDDEDVESLFNIISKLKKRGISVIYITHRLEEIFRICDKASVLKDGNFVGTWNIKEIDRDFLIKAMVGREMEKIFPTRNSELISDKVILSVNELGDGKNFNKISFELHEGEIFGIGGMAGQGQREFLRSLFGIHKFKEGSIQMNGKDIDLSSPIKAIKNGIVFLSDDRRNEGLAQEQSVGFNIAFPTLRKRSNFGIVNKKENEKVINNIISQLNVKLNSISQPIKGLSGGNQQRIVIGKWLPMHPRIILFHEPTLGVDVGAKMEIYELLKLLVAKGLGIVIVTSDMLELVNLSDRIGVFYEGKIIDIFEGKKATEEKIMIAATGKSQRGEYDNI